MHMSGIRLVRVLLLLNLTIIVPAFGRAPIKAALVINSTPEPFAGVLGYVEEVVKAEGKGEGKEEVKEEACGGDFELANVCMHYPFRLELEDFKVESGFLEAWWDHMVFKAPIELSLKWVDEQNRVQQRPVSFGNARKDANFLRVLIKHDALKTHTAYLQKSAFGRLVGYGSSLAESTVDEARFSISQLNCLTFNHFVHYNDTMGFWPVFERDKWQPIPHDSQQFGDMVGMKNESLSEGNHFLMSLGGDRFLSKLGSSDDFIITDLENGLGLYRIGNTDSIAYSVYRAR
jgi:hypothetical protein